MIDWLLIRRAVSVRTYHNIITYFFLIIILLCLVNIGMQHLHGFEPRSYKYNLSLISTLSVLLGFYLVRSHFKDVQRSLPRFTKEEVHILRKYKEITWVLSEDSKKLWAEGYLAYSKFHITENPYQVDTQEYISWQAGNAKAMKYDDKPSNTN
ncbi:hypothetical protein [Acinetobacter baumannii]|uniref:hypothetical protein n=1 Tax=Acinetobacter baumannii TaxID=470 RepID=UPI0004F53317|nr:hypothetical protein [Acinetobacter baumannii]